MKGLILSGGKGTRLRPLTYTSAKQLVPVAGEPVLFYGIEAIADAGIRDIGIVVGTRRPRSARRSATDLDGAFVISNRMPRGLAHAVKISRDFIGDEPFVMLGDNLLNRHHAVRAVRAGEAGAQILLTRVPDPGCSAWRNSRTAKS